MATWQITGVEALTTGVGLLHAVLAAIFWRARRTRRSWGLGWLALAFAASATVNLVLLDAMPGPVGPAYVLLVVMGVTAVAALVVGVRRFIGLPGPSSWRAFAVVVVVFLLLAMSLRLAGLRTLGGHAATTLFFLYLAVLAAGALRRVSGPANALVLASMLLHPAMLALAWWAALDAVTLSRWSSVAFAVIGLGLLAAGLGRYQIELKAELDRRTRAENELRQLNASLERRIAERTQELEDMVGGLESFNRMVSHDLRGPLGGLAGLATLASRAADAGDQTRLKQMLALMSEESHRLVGLVGDLLTLARVNHADLALQATALDTVLDEAVQALSLSLGEGAVARVAREPLPKVRADGPLLRQVFVNLIGNALKFSAACPQAEVRVLGDRRRGEVVVEIRDNGVGFEPARAADLFQPFRRLHGKAYEGIGIGLSIVRRIVERHGGRVWAEGRPGAGASFFFALPD